MEFKVDAKLNGVDEIINTLKKMQQNGERADTKVVEEIVDSTKKVLQNNIPINYGDLRNSIQTIFGINVNYCRGNIYTDVPYAKYVNFGTSGDWFVHKDDPRINLFKMGRYPYTNYWFKWEDYGDGKKSKIWQGYHIYGQKGQHFFERSLDATKNSNLDIAKNIYLDEITRGI